MSTTVHNFQIVGWPSQVPGKMKEVFSQHFLKSTNWGEIVWYEDRKGFTVKGKYKEDTHQVDVRVQISFFDEDDKRNIQRLFGGTES